MTKKVEVDAEEYEYLQAIEEAVHVFLHDPSPRERDKALEWLKDVTDHDAMGEPEPPPAASRRPKDRKILELRPGRSRGQKGPPA